MVAPVIDITHGSHWTSNPNQTAWDAVISQVVSDLQTNLDAVQTCHFSFTIDYGFVNGQALNAGALGQSQQANFPTNYSAIRAALQALTPNSIQATAYNNTNLPSTDPFSATSFTPCNTLTCAIGLTGALTTGANLGFAGFSSTASFDTTVDGSSCAAGKFSLYGVVMHEFSELLGRFCNCNVSSFYEQGDIFTWSSAGTRNFAGSGTAYFSADGGTTNIASVWRTDSSQDFGDLAGNAFHSAFDAQGTTGFAPSRASQPLQARDWQIFTLLGWGLSNTGLANAGLLNPPTISVNPNVTGTLKTGNTLSSDNGTWNNTPTSFSYQWKRNGSNIGGATNSTYTPTNADRDATFVCNVTATNAAGSANQDSNSVGPWLVNTLPSPFLK